MQPLKINNHSLAWGERTYVMGILNATPDSFSGDGLFADEDALALALDQAKGFIEAGVDILERLAKMGCPVE